MSSRTTCPDEGSDNHRTRKPTTRPPPAVPAHFPALTFPGRALPPPSARTHRCRRCPRSTARALPPASPSAPSTPRRLCSAATHATDTLRNQVRRWMQSKGGEGSAPVGHHRPPARALGEPSFAATADRRHLDDRHDEWNSMGVKQGRRHPWCSTHQVIDHRRPRGQARERGVPIDGAPKWRRGRAPMPPPRRSNVDHGNARRRTRCPDISRPGRAWRYERAQPGASRCDERRAREPPRNTHPPQWTRCVTTSIPGAPIFIVVSDIAREPSETASRHRETVSRNM